MTLSLLGLGFVLGLRHALDADHLAAVTTIVSQRKSLLSSAMVGLFWGLGHTSTLLLAGVVVLAIGIPIPDPVSQIMELTVAVVLVGMGVRLIWKLLRGAHIHHHVHRHGDHVHAHPHLHPAGETETGSHVAEHSHSLVPETAQRTGLPSMLLGMLHGLAGSAGLMLLVAATIPDFWIGVAYIAVFGIGSIGGMCAMSTLIGLPFFLTDSRSRMANMVVRALAGAASIIVGILLGWETGMASGLLG
jgi:ABC-type nickel/cobalt efflux system permease component RcnA